MRRCHLFASWRRFTQEKGLAGKAEEENEDQGSTLLLR